MADANTEATVIGTDIHIKGEMSFKKTVRIVGSFEGTITGEGELQVAKGAACQAHVESGSVVVDGILEGNVVAREKVQLNATGVVKGDIVAGSMVMAEGASFFGQCAVGAEAVKKAAASQGGNSAPQDKQGGKPAAKGQPAGAR